MVKVKSDGHIWALEFNRYVCFSFRGNRTIFGSDIANSIFDLEKSRSRSRRKSTKMLSGNLQVRANNRAKNERNQKNCSKVIVWTRICGRRRRRRRRRRTNRYKNIKSPPVYRGDLITCAWLLWHWLFWCALRSAWLDTAWLVKCVAYFVLIGLIGGCVREFQRSKYKFSSHPKTLEITGMCGVTSDSFVD